MSCSMHSGAAAERRSAGNERHDACHILAEVTEILVDGEQAPSSGGHKIAILEVRSQTVCGTLACTEILQQTGGERGSHREHDISLHRSQCLTLLMYVRWRRTQCIGTGQVLHSKSELVMMCHIGYSSQGLLGAKGSMHLHWQATCTICAWSSFMPKPQHRSKQALVPVCLPCSLAAYSSASHHSGDCPVSAEPDKNCCPELISPPADCFICLQQLLFEEDQALQLCAAAATPRQFLAADSAPLIPTPPEHLSSHSPITLRGGHDPPCMLPEPVQTPPRRTPSLAHFIF